VKKELSGRSLSEVSDDDHTLTHCWRGKKPFKSLQDVKKYFKPLALSFTNGGKAKAKFEMPPEAYLIISVSPILILSHCSFLFLSQLQVDKALCIKTLTNILLFQRKGNVCLGILDGGENVNGNIIGGNCWYIQFHLIKTLTHYNKLICFVFRFLFFCRHINAR
jgi:hypothetical protein